MIPKAVDEYFTYLAAYEKQDWTARLNNPVWHQHYGNVPKVELPVPFAMLLNLVSVSNAENAAHFGASFHAMHLKQRLQRIRS